MSDLIIPDVSEFQGSIDWPTLVSSGYPVVIIRAHNGWRADNFWAQNRANAHAAGVRGLGLYQYVVAGADAAQQANAFCDLVGALKPGEWPICDLEEGSGDQSARAHAWYTVVAARLNDAAGEELYSGEYFYNAHQLSQAGFKRIWLAAYGSGEPSEAHELWQFTDSRSFPGVPGTNDASVFHGSVDQLLALINPAEADMTPDELLNAKMPGYAAIKVAGKPDYIPTVGEVLNGAKSADTQLAALDAKVSQVLAAVGADKAELDALKATVGQVLTAVQGILSAGNATVAEVETAIQAELAKLGAALGGIK